jgi:hypothetical protein
MRFIPVALLLLTLLPSLAVSEQVANLDFNDGTFGGFTAGSFWTTQAAGGPDGSKAARLEYSEAGTGGKALQFVVAATQSNQFTMDFDTKFEGIPYGGTKFLKFFGDLTASRNNTTFGVNYYGRTFYDIGYYGDSLCIARYEGGTWCGANNLVTTSSIDPVDGAWHHWKVWLKRADPGMTNGELKVWWDGVLRLHTQNMNSNPEEFADPTPGFYAIELGGYNHASSNGGLDGYFANGITPPWYLWIDNVVIESTYTGPVTPVCDASHLNLCLTQPPCESAGGYWWSDGACHSSQEVITPPTSSVSLRGIGGAARKINGHLLGFRQ